MPELDNSTEAHDRFVAETKHALAATDDDFNAYYVQAFVVASYGTPASVWRWNDTEYMEFTRTQLAGELLYEDGGVDHEHGLPQLQQMILDAYRNVVDVAHNGGGSLAEAETTLAYALTALGIELEGGSPKPTINSGSYITDATTPKGAHMPENTASVSDAELLTIVHRERPEGSILGVSTWADSAELRALAEADLAGLLWVYRTHSGQPGWKSSHQQLEREWIRRHPPIADPTT